MATTIFEEKKRVRYALRKNSFSCADGCKHCSERDQSGAYSELLMQCSPNHGGAGLRGWCCKSQLAIRHLRSHAGRISAIRFLVTYLVWNRRYYRRAIPDTSPTGIFLPRLSTAQCTGLQCQAPLEVVLWPTFSARARALRHVGHRDDLQNIKPSAPGRCGGNR